MLLLISFWWLFAQHNFFFIQYQPVSIILNLPYLADWRAAETILVPDNSAILTSMVSGMLCLYYLSIVKNSPILAITIINVGATVIASFKILSYVNLYLVNCSLSCSIDSNWPPKILNSSLPEPSEPTKLLDHFVIVRQELNYFP